ncbi:hypothetical protein Tco_0694355 [Tanacetum coccineum]
MPRILIPLRPILGVLQIGIKSQGYREPGESRHHLHPIYIPFDPEPVYPEVSYWWTMRYFPAEEHTAMLSTPPTLNHHQLTGDPIHCLSRRGLRMSIRAARRRNRSSHEEVAERVLPYLLPTITSPLHTHHHFLINLSTITYTTTNGPTYVEESRDPRLRD